MNVPTLHKPKVVHRLLIALGLGACFLVMASVFSPQRMLARNTAEGLQLQEPSPWPSTDPHEGLVSLGSVESPTHHVRMYASPDGPRYSVFSAAGEELGVLLSAEQLKRHFPELGIPDADFRGGDQTDVSSGPVMLLDVDRSIPQW